MRYGRTAKRIQTMWSPEYGWCRWDPHLEDYIPEPSLNKKPLQKAVENERKQAQQSESLGQSPSGSKTEVQSGTKRILKQLRK